MGRRVEAMELRRRRRGVGELGSTRPVWLWVSGGRCGGLWSRRVGGAARLVRNHTLAVLLVAAELSSDLAYAEGLVADSEGGTRCSGQRRLAEVLGGCAKDAAA